MRRNTENQCEIIKVICPYKLHCNECDVHNSYNRAYKLSLERFANQNTEFIDVVNLHKNKSNKG